MIMNPVIQGSGEEKTYHITNVSSDYLFQSTAYAGEIVKSKNATNFSHITRIVDDNGVEIPFWNSFLHPLPMLVRAGDETGVYFVMPAANVRIEWDYAPQ